MFEAARRVWGGACVADSAPGPPQRLGAPASHGVRAPAPRVRAPRRPKHRECCASSHVLCPNISKTTLIYLRCICSTLFTTSLLFFTHKTKRKSLLLYPKKNCILISSYFSQMFIGKLLKVLKVKFEMFILR